MDNQLTFKLHINGIVVRVKQRAALILRCFYTRDPQLLVKAFTVYVQPLLEFCMVATFDVSDKLHGRCTETLCKKKLKGMGNLSYDVRVKILNIDRLEIRRIKFDLVLLFKKL